MKKITDIIKEAENQLIQEYDRLNDICYINQKKVLNAMTDNNLSSNHFAWNTGYGYDDIGREVTEAIFAQIFNAEDAIVRPSIANGTHSISLMLTGVLKPGDTLISLTGEPYDTLHQVIGITETEGISLKDIGVNYLQYNINELKNISEVDKYLSDSKAYYFIQRTMGYNSNNKPLTKERIKILVKKIKCKNKDNIILMDNCYGELTEDIEPTGIGIDVVAGSLIKNPGGGLALGGGYIAGKEELIKKISYKLTTNGIGKECGLMYGQTRSILQGLFFAPRVTTDAIKVSLLFAKVFENLGYATSPHSTEKRIGIIQRITLFDKNKLLAFLKVIQKSSPVDSFATPEPSYMPGYENDIIMAAGGFVAGSSIELSCDAPFISPYDVYIQGSLTYEHGKIALENILNEFIKKEYIK